MVLTIDIGNSNVVIVGYTDTKKVFKKRVETVQKPDEAYYEALFRDLAQNQYEAIVVSSVVPAITESVIAQMQAIFKHTILVVNSHNVHDFVTYLDDPHAIGADFIATSLGAYARYQGPVLVVDIGSATKITLTDELGAYRGGVIIPGIASASKAMTQAIPHLPQVELQVPEQVIGTNTVAAIQSGLLYGLIAEVQGLAQMMETEYGVPCKKVLTGGYATLIHEHLPDFIYDEDLLNDGLYVAYKEKRIQ